MTPELALLVDQWIDGTLDAEGAHQLELALNDPQVRTEVLFELKLHGLLASAITYNDADAVVRSVTKRIQAEERADDFVADFWRKNASAEAASVGAPGTFGTFNPTTATNATFAPRSTKKRRRWLPAAAAMAAALGAAIYWPHTPADRPTSATRGADEPQLQTQEPSPSDAKRLSLADGSRVLLRPEAEAYLQEDGYRLVVRAGQLQVRFAAPSPGESPVARVLLPDGTEVQGAGSIVNINADPTRGVFVTAMAGLARLYSPNAASPLALPVGGRVQLPGQASPLPQQSAPGSQPMARDVGQGIGDVTGQALSVRTRGAELNFTETLGLGSWTRDHGWIVQSQPSELPGRHEEAPIWKGRVDLGVPFSLSTVVVADKPATDGFFTLGFLTFWHDAPMVGCHLVGRAGGGRVVRLEALKGNRAAAPFQSMEDFPWQPVTRSQEDVYQLRFDAQAIGKPLANGHVVVRVRCQAWPVEEEAAPMDWGPTAEIDLSPTIKALALRTYRVAGRFSEPVVLSP